MKQLIVIAEKEELKLVEQLELKNIPVLITGVGALNVIQALNELPKDIEIINVGYAGSKNLTPDFYEVGVVTLNHPNVEYPEPRYFCKRTGRYVSKTCYTGCDFVLDTELDDCLFDMELAYIKSLGFKNVISYKYVSDNLDLQEYRNKINESE